jgi:hypothetical protein
VQKFLIHLSIYTAAIASLTFGTSFLFQNIIQNYFYLILLFFFIFTFANHFVLLRISKMKMLKFSNNFMTLSTVKLLLFVIVITVVLLLYKKLAIPFIVYFLIQYMFFTIFEVVNITSYLRNEKLTPKDH